MGDDILHHLKIDSASGYTEALDWLCRSAQHNLYCFEKNYDGMGFNGEARYNTLRNFLLANPANRLFILTHETGYLTTRCPRMIMLLQQFGSSMFIHQTPKNLQHLTEPFTVADDTHYVRRFHFDAPHGLLAQNDPQNARALKSRFMEMWSASHQGVSAGKLGL
ncbi:MAG: hypothetical protein ACOY3V_01000 [Pseudomonadota bacterium]